MAIKRKQGRRDVPKILKEQSNKHVRNKMIYNDIIKMDKENNFLKQGGRMIGQGVDQMAKFKDLTLNLNHSNISKAQALDKAELADEEPISGSEYEDIEEDILELKK